MKSWILLIVLAVGLTAAATVAVPLLTTGSAGGPQFAAPVAGASDQPAGTAEVDGDLTHKFGVMAQDSEGAHTWTFKNPGPGPLELRNLGTDCSCTVAQLGKPDSADSAPSSLVIPAGASEPIEVKWNTRKIDGGYRKNARIGTNDPKRPEITLAVEGTVRPAVSIVPADPSISFGTANNDEETRRALGLYSGDRPDIKLIRVATSDPARIAVEVRPMTDDERLPLKAEKGHAIVLTLKPGAHLGAFAEEVVIETDHPLKKEIRLPVLGRVIGPITATPDKVLLRDVTSSDGGGQDLTLWVRGRTSTRFEVQAKPDALDVSFEPIPQPANSKGSKYRMAVKVIPGTPGGRISGEIVLKTDHPQATEVRVPVDVLVQGAN